MVIEQIPKLSSTLNYTLFEKKWAAKITFNEIQDI